MKPYLSASVTVLAVRTAVPTQIYLPTYLGYIVWLDGLAGKRP